MKARHLLLVLPMLAAACAGGQPSTGTGAAQSIAVTVQPPSALVAPGGTTRFSGTVTGTADTTVTWSVAEGASCGSVAADGTYTAPPSAATCHVVATSHADPSRSAAASVAVDPAGASAITISLSPSTATLDACGTQRFSATVANASDTRVTWSVLEGTGGSVTSGNYTAPQAPGTYHVVATSVADPTRQAQATLTIGPEKVLSVAVSPASTTVQGGAAVALAATVTTSCGSYAAQ